MFGDIKSQEDLFISRAFKKAIWHFQTIETNSLTLCHADYTVKERGEMDSETENFQSNAEKASHVMRL